MNLFEFIPLILENLARRKARVALTAIGVVIGTAAVVVLVSLGIGLQKSATSNLYGIGDLTLIEVSPKWVEPVAFDGQVQAAASGPGRPEVSPFQKLIDDQALADFAALPNVVAVIPREYFQGMSILRYNRLESYSSPLGMGTDDLSLMGWTAQQGELTLEKGVGVIGAQFATYFFDPRIRPGQEPPPPPDLIGETVRMILIKHDPEGNEIRKAVQFRVGGIIAERADHIDWSFFMHLEDVNAYNEWFMGRRTNRNLVGYPSVAVKVADAQDSIDVHGRILDMGFEAYTSQTYLESINSFYLVMQIMFGGVGAIALVVAAIGIANTMAMAILERTREIGLMKAIGATNRDVLAIFLGEAAGIGLLGGLGGVLVGWSAGQILNVLAAVYMAGQWAQQGGPPPNIAVITPPWLLGSTLLFATLIGLLSGIYPALRAANLIPVMALKYE